jgi:hypothetical protein
MPVAGSVLSYVFKSVFRRRKSRWNAAALKTPQELVNARWLRFLLFRKALECELCSN